MVRTKAASAKSVCHRCFGKNQQPFGGAPCTGADTSELPKGTCLGGIRETIMFPTYVLTPPSPPNSFCLYPCYIYEKLLTRLRVVAGMERTLTRPITNHIFHTQLVVPSSQEDLAHRHIQSNSRRLCMRLCGILAHSTIRVFGPLMEVNLSFTAWVMRKCPLNIPRASSNSTIVLATETTVITSLAGKVTACRRQWIRDAISTNALRPHLKQPQTR